MAITLVQLLTPASTSSPSGSTLACGFPSPTTIGNLVILICGAGIASGYTASDTAGNSYSRIGSTSTDFNWSFTTASISGSTITITGGAAGNMAVVGAEFAGVGSLDPLSTGKFNLSTLATPSSQQFTTTGLGELIIGGTSYNFPASGSSTTYTATSGYTSIGQAASTDTHHGDTNDAICADYLLSNSSSPVQEAPTMGTTSASGYTCGVIAFLPPAAARIIRANPYIQLLGQ